MTSPSEAFVLRRCQLRDVAPVADLLKLCWHGTYDPILGEAQAGAFGQRVYSKFNLGAMIARSLMSRELMVLVAIADYLPVGYAVAQRDGATEIILYGLYVHPNWKGRGVGSALL